MIRLLLSLLLLLQSCTVTRYVTSLQQDDKQQEKTQGDANEPGSSQPPGNTVLQLSWSHDTQLFDRKRSVFGLRLGAASSDNEHVSGVDFNLGFGISDGGNGIAVSLLGHKISGPFNGIQIAGGMNWNFSHTRKSGIQVAGLFNRALSGQVAGIQLAGLLNDYRSHYGLQIALLNRSRSAYGLQGGFANWSTNSYGLQIGVMNHCHVIQGMQIGLVNGAHSGLQIGLININKSGFLPVFPFFNF